MTRGITATTASERRVRGKKGTTDAKTFTFIEFDRKLRFVYSFTRNPYAFQNNCIVCFFFSPFLDAILNMVNNIAANVLGGKPDQEGGTETGGTPPSST